MAIHVLGSVNIDHSYRVPHAPGPGETLADGGYVRGLGGKGCNQALAAAAAGAAVRLVGAVGAEGGWCREALAAGGVDVSGLATVAAATGHAIILVEPSGENRIVIHGGANRAITGAMVAGGIAAARPGDWWLAQNETSRVAESLAAARAAGLRTAYAAAPFDPAAAAEALPHTDLLALNAVEAAALAAHLGTDPAALPAAELLVTRGREGAELRGPAGTLSVPALPVEPVDTTGAGDCFLGYFLAGRDRGLDDGAALARAAAAAALSVTRPGAAAAIPTAAETDAFLAAGRG
ncbi:ribokinase [Paralimibaculum aggregatum]|uniref:Ribokinase n=1 Tax=Paralimibaculum aggregatum TaxID=3036245 RepID=A0ABQ6LGI8_9RHOB|nr:PfkB family carbohydrate kinase [Limibaculum sp. NKW23]GMG81159.1 ribokinase [Limibaculum sp. NKW23]